LVFAATCVGSVLHAAPLFRPVPVSEHIYAGGWEHFVGGGVAVLDCNGDGLPELFVAGGENPTELFENTSQNRAVSFVARTPEPAKIRGATGAYPIDIDGDGYLDLVVLRVGRNVILKGGAACSFTPFTSLHLDSRDAWTTAFSATWENGQEMPTLAFGNYVDRGNPAGPFKACDSNDLYRPTGKEYREMRPLNPSYCTLSMLFSDWSRDGISDLRVSNDRHYYVDVGQEQLWHMEPQPRLYSEAEGWMPYKLWGMGIASRDLTGDGLPEVMMSSMGDQRLQTRDLSAAGPHFGDVAYDLGTTAQRPYTGGDGRPSTGWHIAFGDVQNDGRDDIFIAKGNVEQMPDLAQKDPNNLLIQNENGKFVETGEAAGIASLHRSRGAALVDLNGDGLLDIVVVNRRAPLEVYQNVTMGAGNWLTLELRQDGGNRNAVGSWIEVQTPAGVLVREITVGGGHAGGQMVGEHFGLGAEGRAKLRVIWPDGQASGWQELAANQVLVLQREGREFRVQP
jgi:hypothetical protein